MNIVLSVRQKTTLLVLALLCVAFLALSSVQHQPAIAGSRGMGTYGRESSVVELDQPIAGSRGTATFGRESS